MKKNRDYIANLFSQDGLRAPESLSEESIRERLPEYPEAAEPLRFPEGPEPVKKNRRKKTYILRGMAAAACLMIAVLAVPQVMDRTGGPSGPGSAETLQTFQNYNEVRKLVRKLDRQGYSFSARGWDEMAVVEEEAAAPDSGMADSKMEASANAAGESAAGAGGDHSSTYLQVENVDEADIVKTDGKYIYCVNENKEVLIYSADGGNTEKVAVIGSGGVDNYIHDIYLKEDTLVTVGVVYDDDERSSAVITYDISDRASPELLSQFRQSGEIVSSRMVGKYVYLVTSESVSRDGRAVPKVTCEGSYQEMDVSDICAVPEPEYPSYVVLSAVDIVSGEGEACRSKAVLGASDDIYCNNENLYTAAAEYNDKLDDSMTRIVRASLDGKKIRFDATGTVAGTIDNQFSMDEKDGWFRIATTSNRDGVETNNLYVLDEKLQEAGRVSGFARNESIRAVRYVGDKAYVITFEEVDPLFIIDLSNPASPQIEGQVEIEGFSSLLVPVREGRMLGIGYTTEDNGYGGVYTDGLKLALFDVSDPSHPAVLDSEELRGMNSPAQADHHALVVNPEKGYCAIPYNTNHYSETWTPDDVIIEDAEEGAASESGEGTSEAGEEDVMVPTETGEENFSSGVLLFGADDEISLYGRRPLADEYLQRNVYIGDWIYALDGKGELYSFQYR